MKPKQKSLSAFDYCLGTKMLKLNRLAFEICYFTLILNVDNQIITLVVV